MAYFVGLDVSVKETLVCVVDDSGKVISEQKVLTEPDNIITLLTSIGETYARIGIEAGPLSQWLVNALIAADLPVIPSVPMMMRQTPAGSLPLGA